MEPQVIVANFSSVLQLEFATNILFLLFELKPVVDKQWRKLDSDFERTLQTAWQRFLDEPKDRGFFSMYMKLTGPRVLYIGLEFSALLFSAASSITALWLLIACGFDTTLAIPRDGMSALCWVSFATLPVYYALAQWLVRYSKRRFVKAASDLEGTPPQ